MSASEESIAACHASMAFSKRSIPVYYANKDDLNPRAYKDTLAITPEECVLLIKLLSVIRGDDDPIVLGWDDYCNVCQGITVVGHDKFKRSGHDANCWLKTLREIQARPDYENLLAVTELRFEQCP